MQWVPQTVVIGSQGVLDVADMTATQEAPFGGIDQVGQQVRLEWARRSTLFALSSPAERLDRQLLHLFEDVLDPLQAALAPE